VTGLTDLAQLISSMQPVQVPGEFVFVSVAVPRDDLDAHAMVREPEGISYVLPRADADSVGLPYDFVAGWITLRVHSALGAVGMTAAVSAALAEAQISCNVIAGSAHDHLLVPHARTQEALGVLQALAGSTASGLSRGPATPVPGAPPRAPRPRGGRRPSRPRPPGSPRRSRRRRP